jgi:hypothetical protein
MTIPNDQLEALEEAGPGWMNDDQLSELVRGYRSCSDAIEKLAGIITLARLVQSYRKLQLGHGMPGTWDEALHAETLESEIDTLLDALGFPVDR